MFSRTKPQFGSLKGVKQTTKKGEEKAKTDRGRASALTALATNFQKPDGALRSGRVPALYDRERTNPAFSVRFTRQQKEMLSPPVNDAGNQEAEF